MTISIQDMCRSEYFSYPRLLRQRRSFKNNRSYLFRRSSLPSMNGISSRFENTHLIFSILPSILTAMLDA